MFQRHAVGAVGNGRLGIDFRLCAVEASVPVLIAVFVFQRVAEVAALDELASNGIGLLTGDAFEFEFHYSSV